MKCKWHMQESEFHRMVEDMKKEDFVLDNFYGGLAIGKLLLEFVTYDIVDENKLIINMFEAGLDTGYGELDDGTPYDFLVSMMDEDMIKLDGTFEEFKETVITELNRTATPHIRKLMESEEEPKWYADEDGTPNVEYM